MPRKLKNLLIAIDGSTDDAVYSAILWRFGEVKQQLRLLAAAGLIAEVAALKSSVPAGQAPEWEAEFDGSDWGVDTVPSTPPLADPSAGRDADPMPDAVADLMAAIDKMSDFVLVHLPGHALYLLPEIESLQTFTELSVVMPGYQHLLISAGAAGAQHVAELQQLIQGHDTSSEHHEVLRPTQPTDPGRANLP